MALPASFREVRGHTPPHFLGRLGYAMASAAAIIGVAACVLMEVSRKAFGGSYIVTLSAHKGGECRYIVGHDDGLIWNFITPWPCEQPKARIPIRLEHSAGYGTQEPFLPTRAQVRSHDIDDVLGWSYGSATLYVNNDGSVPFGEREQATARSTIVRFWGVMVRYGGVWRYAFYLWLLWIAWTTWLVSQRVGSWRRSKIGKCAKCGYDLRASKKRCPECGTPVIERPLSMRVADTRSAAARGSFRGVAAYLKRF
jgi:predicted RNA-binding Zn-ribbon protein involved in translation (DUF1610 family)